MPRKFLLANNYYYHIFNRGVEKRPTFTDAWEFYRAKKTMEYYRFVNLPFKYSQFLKLDGQQKSILTQTINQSPCHIEILAYCFMPNHFHFLLKQCNDSGISSFMSRFTNSYTKYFNTKHTRVGPLFQGLFKAVLIEDTEQLIHVSRYIHLNPVSSMLIEAKNMHLYKWSSYPTYVEQLHDVVNSTPVLENFSGKKEYKEFVMNQVGYARSLNRIKHLTFD